MKKRLILALCLLGSAAVAEVHVTAIGAAAPAGAANRKEPRPVEELRPLAEAGDAEAQCELGWRLASGEGVEKNPEEAAALFRKAAEAGNAVARRNLGVSLLRGAGVERDAEAAVAELGRAADAGDWRSALMLHALHQGQSGGPFDPAKAEKWRLRGREMLEEAVAKGGDSEAEAMLGQMLVIERDTDRGVALLRSAAEAGDPEGQSGLGECCRLGIGVPQSFVQAFNWHFLAANQGDAFSQYMVACFFFHGDGVGRDEAQAVAWARKAAEQDWEMAQYNLGCCYRDGVGVEADREQAAAWLRRAADNGSRDAAVALEAMSVGGGIPVLGPGGAGLRPTFEIRRSWGR